MLLVRHLTLVLCQGDVVFHLVGRGVAGGNRRPLAHVLGTLFEDLADFFRLDGNAYNAFRLVDDEVFCITF